MQIDKSLATTTGAALLTLLGVISPAPARDFLLNAGLFALSGALTNWLAVHMLFERVPGFYGSGVIPLHFEEFKSGIRNLIMQQFFSQKNIDNFLAQSEMLTAGLEREINRTIDEVDLNGAFESLLDVIMASSFSGMIGMLGGRDAFKPLREPFTARMREYLHKMVSEPTFRQRLTEGLANAGAAEDLQRKIEHIVDRRLAELTPAQVKVIVEEMIRRHLGWLVVWGGVLGGLMGLLVAAFGAWFG